MYWLQSTTDLEDLDHPRRSTSLGSGDRGVQDVTVAALELGDDLVLGEDRVEVSGHALKDLDAPAAHGMPEGDLRLLLGQTPTEREQNQRHYQ